MSTHTIARRVSFPDRISIIKCWHFFNKTANSPVNAESLRLSLVSVATAGKKSALKGRGIKYNTAFTVGDWLFSEGRFFRGGVEGGRYFPGSIGEK